MALLEPLYGFDRLDALVGSHPDLLGVSDFKRVLHMLWLGLAERLVGLYHDYEEPRSLVELDYKCAVGKHHTLVCRELAIFAEQVSCLDQRHIPQALGSLHQGRKADSFGCLALLGLSLFFVYVLDLQAQLERLRDRVKLLAVEFQVLCDLIGI